MYFTPNSSFFTSKDFIKFDNLLPDRWWVARVKFNDDIDERKKVRKDSVNVSKISHAALKIEIGRLGCESALVLLH